jgi:hypothetical protein
MIMAIWYCKDCKTYHLEEDLSQIEVDLNVEYCCESHGCYAIATEFHCPNCGSEYVDELDEEEIVKRLNNYEIY